MADLGAFKEKLMADIGATIDSAIAGLGESGADQQESAEIEEGEEMPPAAPVEEVEEEMPMMKKPNMAKSLAGYMGKPKARM